MKCNNSPMSPPSQDKILLLYRKNGTEVATLFDQNHTDNHKNSMASQSVLLELEEGDRVQVQIDR